MSGPKRTADKLNTIGIIVVGICSAVLVYVTIVALQAFYASDTSEVQTMADYGGQDTQARNLKAQQMGEISKSIPNAAPKKTDEVQTYRIPIKVAMEKVVAEAKKDCADELVPVVGPSVCRTTVAEFGRPKPDENKPCPDWGKGEQPKRRCAGGAPMPQPPPADPTPAPASAPGGAGSGAPNPP
jgi:hypothetical protein